MRQIITAFFFLLATSANAQYSTRTHGGSWSLQQYSDKILRISFRPAGDWQNYLFSDAVIAKPKAFAVNRQAGNLQVGDWHLQHDSSAGLLLLHFGNVQDTLRLGFFADSAEAGFRIGLHTGERIYGGGERAISMDRRGYSFPLYNNPWYGYSEGADALNFSVPFFLSSRGYALFFDNPSKGYADIGKSDPAVFEAGFSGGELNVYVIIGANMDEQVRAFSGLTGHQPLPPRWALGNFMSRFGYSSQQQVEETLAKMQAEKFPVDAVILDLFWFGDSIKGTLGNLDWVNKTKWPDPKGMIDSLKAKNIKTILVTEPFVLEGTKNYTASKPYLAVDSAGRPYTLTNFYFGRGGLIDLFRKDAREWFWGKYQAQIKLGVAGWWGDLGEPEKHPANLYHNTRDLGLKKLVPADLVHNLYGYYWSKMLAEKYKSLYPKTRLFYLNRAGYAGSARYGIFPWTGDVSRSWSGFRAQLPLLQGMSISGVPYIHSDAGGFAGGDNDAELYTRWLQFAVFTPIFRPHGTNVGAIDPGAISIPSEPALWPDSVKAIALKAVTLRYDLLPYNYTLAYEQTQFGKPLVRPMNYYSYTDSNLAKAVDQYMWGDELLVAPVLEKGASSRRLYLPKGDWYDFFTNRRQQGGQWVEEKTYADRIPVYVKAGSFVPTRPGLKNTADYKTRYLRVKHYIGPGSSEFMMYDDDGADPNALLTDNYERIFFQSRETGNGPVITVKSGHRRYKGQVVKKRVVLEIVGFEGRPSSVKLDGLLVPYQNKYEERSGFKGDFSYWDPLNQYLRIVFDYTGNEQEFTISY
ncbi:TIM-barrel domain-containing protein [Flavihumibacter profundi]|uniref:TIM-barrel domain-containing protein n=1 Tax=Flavihumibacter profundi TaxID=2716883 RepID=UPI001CC34423|nr:TIM-barrel domain-containing protein [Flavihumibacter profundi]MBZ5858381.1 hypothetical protein [Flavihumibacter profundi]